MDLYNYGLFLTLKTCFKVVKAPLVLKWTISTWLGVNCYKLYQVDPQSQCNSLFRSVRGIYLFFWPHNPMGYNENVVSVWGDDCDIPYRIGEKVPIAK